MTKAAVILSGCGFMDGAEITETVSVFISLEKHGVDFACYAPDEEQQHCIEHLSGKETESNRNVLAESARITRGRVRDWQDLHVSDYDALILPGGFGVAKNLSDYAFKGIEMAVHSRLEAILLQFKEQRKPIGAICIAPVVLAKVFPQSDMRLTIGDDTQTASHIESFGCKHHSCSPGEIAVDELQRVVSTPAYMYGDSSALQVYNGIEKLVAKVVKLANETQ